MILLASINVLGSIPLHPIFYSYTWHCKEVFLIVCHNCQPKVPSCCTYEDVELPNRIAFALRGKSEVFVSSRYLSIVLNRLSLFHATHRSACSP